MQQYATKSTQQTTHSPQISHATAKQKKVLTLIYEGKNPTLISRLLKKDKSTITRHLQACEKKELVFQDSHTWQLTKTGKNLILRSCVGSCTPKEKNIHSNLFTVNILDLPRKWNDGFFFQCLKAKNYFSNKSNNQWIIEFEQCKLVISPVKRKIDFWIKKQTGNSYDEIISEVWDIFIEYWKLLSNKGFSLDNHVSPKNPEYANPNGFFSKLASLTTHQGLRIDTKHGQFWIDFSPPELVAEEETDQEEIARRMESLADSAINSNHDFTDLDKVIEVTKDLVKLQLMRIRPKPQITQPTEKPHYLG